MASSLVQVEDNECPKMQMDESRLIQCVGETRSVSIEDFKSPLPPRHNRWAPPQKSRVTLTLDQAIEHELKHGRKVDPTIDNKTLRRTISNRLSAQRSRMKRLEHINELENRLKYLEVLTSGLRPKVEMYKEKKRMLEEERAHLKTAVDIRTAESINNEYEIEERRREIEILKNSLNNDEGQSIPQGDDGSQPKPKPYSLEYFQQRLMQMETNQLLIPNSAPQMSEQDPMIELNLEDDDVEVEVEVDQYLNFDGVV